MYTCVVCSNSCIVAHLKYGGAERGVQQRAQEKYIRDMLLSLNRAVRWPVDGNFWYVSPDGRAWLGADVASGD